VEAVAGFGGTVIALSLGARWFGIEALLAWFPPLNLGLSAALALRGRRVIAWRTLGTAILPMIFAGLAGGPRSPGRSTPSAPRRSSPGW